MAGIMIVISSIKNRKKLKMIENQSEEQTKGLYNNNDVQPQTNNVNAQFTQPMNNVEQSKMNSINQQNSNVDINNSNNQNSNINTNM